MRSRTATHMLTLAALLILTVLPTVTEAQETPPVTMSPYEQLTAPSLQAQNFGRQFSLSENRLVTTATVDGQRVAYVFDRTSSGWVASGEIPKPADATASWGNGVATNGTTIAITDSGWANPNVVENYGRAHLYELSNGTWSETTTVARTERFGGLSSGVWLTSEALLLHSTVVCDADCGYGRWYLHELGPAGATLIRSGPQEIDRALNVAVADDHLAIATPRIFHATQGGVIGNRIRVIETASPGSPDAYVLTRPDTEPDWHRRVAAGGGVVAHVACCSQRSEIHVLRRAADGSYGAETVLPLTSPVDALVSVSDVILSVPAGGDSWQTHTYDAGEWSAANQLPLPAGALSSNCEAGSPPWCVENTRPTAAGATVAVGGDNVVYLATVEVESTEALCFGLEVSVDIAAGEQPTSGNDVILGTADDDTIKALGGNDVVCGLDGNDTIIGGAGNDLVLGGAGNDRITLGSGNDVGVGGPGGDVVRGGAGTDVVAGGRDNDVVVGGAGDDWVLGGEGRDLVVGARGADLVIGGEGDDLIFGGRDDDRLFGQDGADQCTGGSGTDTLDSCEIVNP